MREELLQCSEFVNDASIEVTLTSDKIADFKQTYLCRHRLAYVQYREPRSKVPEDQDFAASRPEEATSQLAASPTTRLTAASEQRNTTQLTVTSKPQKISVLKWNFPNIAEM